jgi:hypothetical protein
MRFKGVADEGASHDTRWRVCSPECFAPALGEDWRGNLAVDNAVASTTLPIPNRNRILNYAEY